ncbi:MAG: glycosyltransferase [Betaproteobacteria bacterium]|nr:glycosyltransferase [Betaproteobacteria bacterium]
MALDALDRQDIAFFYRGGRQVAVYALVLRESHQRRGFSSLRDVWSGKIGAPVRGAYPDPPRRQQCKEHAQVVLADRGPLRGRLQRRIEEDVVYRRLRDPAEVKKLSPTQTTFGKQPVVSVVIAAFNHGAYLPQAIESVLAQDYPDVELIVVDDGSTDDTPRILDRYRSSARVFRQSNSGQAHALNTGWAASRGEILSYLGADDLLEPFAITRAVDCLGRHPEASLAYCDYLLIDHASNVVRRVTTGDFDRKAMLACLICFPGPGVFFRRAAYLQAGKWSEALRQIPDFEYWLRLSRSGPFIRVPQVLTRYRVHEGSQSFALVDAVRAEEPARVMREFFASAPSAAEELQWRDEGIANGHVLSARLHIRSGRLRPGLRHLVAAAQTCPAILLSFHTYHLLINALLNRGTHKLLWAINKVRR